MRVRGFSRSQDCYIPLEGCEYRALNVDDFHILSQTLLRRFVIIDTNELKSFLLKPGHPAEEMPFFEAGLRYLLAYPLTWGVLFLTAPTASWRLQEGRTVGRRPRLI